MARKSTTVSPFDQYDVSHPRAVLALIGGTGEVFEYRNGTALVEEVTTTGLPVESVLALGEEMEYEAFAAAYRQAKRDRQAQGARRRVAGGKDKPMSLSPFQINVKRHVQRIANPGFHVDQLVEVQSTSPTWSGLRFRINEIGSCWAQGLALTPGDEMYYVRVWFPFLAPVEGAK